MLKNRGEWWVPGKIVELRHRLKPYWQAEGSSRDILLLDIALDNYFRLCVERTDKGALSGEAASWRAAPAGAGGSGVRECVRAPALRALDGKCVGGGGCGGGGGVCVCVCVWRV